MPKSNRKRSVKRMRGGDCGCNKSIFTGGLALGPATAINVGSQSTIPLNSYQNDPIAPSAQDATRMDPNPIAPWNPFSGGKRSKGKRRIRKSKNQRKSKKNSSRRRRIRGGSDPSSDAILNGPLLSTGTVMGAPIGANIVMGNNIPLLNPHQANSTAPFV